MNYIELKIPKPLDALQFDLLIADLGETGYESFAEEEDWLMAYIPEKDFDAAAMENILGADFSMDDIIISRIAEKNWNEVWEQNYSPVLVDERCSIRAPFHQAPTEVEYDIVLNPKMAFGTAHHETTAMMISMMLEVDFQDKSVLDMGCGTGVLAILSKMMGAAQVVAIDNDKWAFENTLENTQLNHLEGIEIKHGDAALLAEYKPFQLMLANINRNILMKDIPLYSETLVSGGQLFLSGFLAEDLENIKACSSENGLKFVFHREKNKWVAAIFQKQ
ncbi:MAG: 50S ribosomal protein L11 methyltransferase [bacterium]